MRLIQQSMTFFKNSVNLDTALPHGCVLKILYEKRAVAIIPHCILEGFMLKEANYLSTLAA